MSGKRLARVEMSAKTLEQILTASENDHVVTNCPQDLKVVRVHQTGEEQANGKFSIIVTSDERDDWPFVESWHDIPTLMPFTYTVVDPDKDQSPPKTEETSDGQE